MTEQIIKPRVFTGVIGDREISIEAGKLAQQAGGAVTVRVGETMLFCAATMSKSAREGMSFFPLSVDYEEKLYAAGRIPGSFQRREGRPSDRAVLVSRVIDRTLRPLFPKNMRNEVQIILTSLSHDQENHVDMLGVIAASAALMISDIPWSGPVAGVRVGLIDGELIANPTITEMEESKLDLRISGTEEAVNMVECTAEEVDEETMVRAFELAQEATKPIIQMLRVMRDEIGKPKNEIVEEKEDEAFVEDVRQRTGAEVREIVTSTKTKEERADAIDALRDAVFAEYEAKNAELPEDAEPITKKNVVQAVEQVLKEVVRERILNEGIRPDERDTTTIRPLSAEVGLIPRVHGSGLFQRGETQVMTVATLGTPRDSQTLDGLDAEDSKRYLHHYNFPPFSTGETGRLGSPRRREIGHGTLAENALLPMIPDEAEFPYTIRLVSEVMSSNGSTSMASVCGSTLALMDAGVPIKRPVAGIAMGLIKDGERYAVLTDIQGMEDHLGDMDFKVAGTRDGITALQMDIKIAGVTDDIMRQALAQARDARLQILDLLLETIAEPRPELNDYAPRMITIKIDPEKIGQVIGPGGKSVRAIQEDTGVRVDIAEDGTVFISGSDGPSVYVAKDRIRSMTEEAELGQIYTGKIKRIENYGVFVEFLPSKEGMVHVSQLADHRIGAIEEEFKVNDEIMVMVTDVDPGGRVRLSRQAVLEGWTLDEARERDRGTANKGGGGNRGGSDRGGGNRGGGNRGGGNRGGGDRGGGNRSGGDRGGNRGGGDRGGNRGGSRNGGD